MVSIADKLGRPSIPTDYAESTTVKTARTAGESVLATFDLSKFAVDTPVYFLTYRKTVDPEDPDKVLITNQTSWKALVNADNNTLTNLTLAPGYTDVGNAVGDYVECIPSSLWGNDLITALLKSMNPDGSLILGAGQPVGSITEYAGTTAPAGYLMADGASVLRADYPSLFEVIGTTYGSVDSTHFTIPDRRQRAGIGAGAASTKIAKFASRAGNVLTLTGLSSADFDEFQTGQAVVFNGTMGGLTNGNTYYVRRVAANTFSLSTSRLNAVNGTVITLSNDGSGDRTFTLSLTTRTLGETGGEEAHALIRDELAQHTHTWNTTSSLVMNSLTNPGVSQFNGGNGQLGVTSMQNSGGNNQAHNNMQPWIALNYIIKT